jgi:hypothetical protein
MTTDLFTLVLTAYLVMAAAMVGLCCHGSEHAWMALALDRPDRQEVGATESHGHSLGGATGPCKPGRGLSSLPTDDERVLSMVSLGLAMNAEKACYRDPASTNSQDSLSLT